MSTLESILSLLDKWPAWKRIRSSPERLDDLEKRVNELAERLNRAPGDACPFCGALEYRVKTSAPIAGHLGRLGVIRRKMLCGECGKGETKTVTPE